MSIVIAILLFGFLIFIHEAGHYFFARIFRVKINEFAIGMGPKIVSHTSKKSGIAYSLRLLPIGGFVSMAGENDEDEDENAFYKKPVWQRIIITAAGAAVNIIVGILVMFIIVINSDKLASTTVAEFINVEGCVSTEQQGLAAGDKIIGVNGTSIHTGNDLQYEIMREGNLPVNLEVERDGEILELYGIEFPVVTEQSTEFGYCDFKVFAEEKTAVNLLKHATVRSFTTIKMIYDSLFDLISGRYGVEAVSGPVGVTKALGDAAKESTSSLVYLAVVISINLGVMNLLPLPALDGGRLLFQIIELITRRKVPTKIEGFVHFVGLVLLMVLMVIIVVKDIVTIF